MSSDLSTSAAHDEGLSHEALLYHGRAELTDAAREFVRAGAAPGEPVLVAVPRANLEWLRTGLAEEAANVRFEDMNEVGGNPACILPMIQQWLDEHDGRARMISEPMWPERSYAETAECLRHEALLNHALAGTGARILCPYDAENLDADVLEGAELTHPLLRDAAGGRPSEGYEDPLRGSLSERWPLDDPTGPMSEHIFAGDLRSLRHAVVADPSLEGLTRERREDVVFVVNEVATNAIRHGNGRCTARLWHDGSSVVTEVSFDTSVPDVLAGRVRPLSDAVDGRGLWLINQMCALVQLRSGGMGTTLRMHVR
jgi:DcmR-like sensory protein/histidine kinase-like protein